VNVGYSTSGLPQYDHLRRRSRAQSPSRTIGAERKLETHPCGFLHPPKAMTALVKEVHINNRVVH